MWPFYQQYGKTVKESAKYLNFDILFIEVDLMNGTSFDLSLNKFDALFYIKIKISNSRPCSLFPPKAANFFHFPKRYAMFLNVYAKTNFRFFYILSFNQIFILRFWEFFWIRFRRFWRFFFHFLLRNFEEKKLDWEIQWKKIAPI